MKTTKKTVTKDDTLSRKDKKKDTAPTTITAAKSSTGTKKKSTGPAKTGTKSQANAEKKSGVSSTGSQRVKSNTQVDKKISSKKDRSK
ncbi:MAG: hypothetical protein M3Q58_03570 [Bacteroidota bacterium]|nr:hypothetical protein [Bacteroidota bacterium]